MRVLVVDDNEEARDVVGELVELQGHEVVDAVADGAAAVAALTHLTADVVLVDLRLKDESGYDVARALTSMQPGLAVILMSMDNPSAVRGREAGACAVIAKDELFTVDLTELLEDRGDEQGRA